jgi:hypothetical protein
VAHIIDFPDLGHSVRKYSLLINDLSEKSVFPWFHWVLKGGKKGKKKKKKGKKERFVKPYLQFSALFRCLLISKMEKKIITILFFVNYSKNQIKLPKTIGS